MSVLICESTEILVKAMIKWTLYQEEQKRRGFI
jgi:hypothetical protein